MTTATLEQRVTKIIAEQVGIEPEQIKPESELAFDLGFDSLDLVEGAMHLEEEFKINIDDDQFIQLKTVQQVIDHVRELVEVTA